MELKYNLSKNLRAIRKEQKKSLSSFSEEISVPKSTLQNIENGKGATLDTVDYIAGQVHVPVGALLADDLPEKETGIMVQLVKGLNWLEQLGCEDRDAIVSHLAGLCLILSRYDFGEGAL